MKKIALCFIGMIASSAHAAVIVNGSFEQSQVSGAEYDTLYPGSSALTGWTIGRGSVDLVNTYWTASDGKISLDLAGQSEGAIEQILQTTAGQGYRVSFDLSANPVGPQLRLVEVSAAGQTGVYGFAAANSATDMGWVGEAFDFVANGPTTTLRFAALNGASWGAALDNVAITATPAVPEPASWALMILGFNFVGFAMRRALKSDARQTC